MKRGIAKQVMALGIAVCMAATTAVAASPPMQLRAVPLVARAQEPQTAQNAVPEASLNEETYSNERLDNGYTKVSAGYTFAAYTGEPILYRMGDVPQSAVYYMNFDYLANSESILPVEAGIMVNGEYPFYEMRQQKLESQWTSNPDQWTLAPRKVYDSYGNEVVSMPDKIYDWQNKYIQDSTYRYTQPLGIELQRGRNTITIELNEGTLLLGNLTLTAKPQVPEYTVSEAAAGDGFIEIQAEDFLYRNDSGIHAACEFDPDLYPYQAAKRVMNTVDAASFGQGGQEITYLMEVEKAGNYYIAFHYSQGDKADFPVFMNVKIDGRIPNTAFETCLRV